MIGHIGAAQIFSANIYLGLQLGRFDLDTLKVTKDLLKRWSHDGNYAGFLGGFAVGKKAFWGFDVLYWMNHGKLEDKSILGPTYGVGLFFGYQFYGLRPFMRIGYTAMRVLGHRRAEAQYAHGAFGGPGLDIVLHKNLWLGAAFEWRANLSLRSMTLPAGTIGSFYVKFVI